MILKKIDLKNFRNFSEKSFIFNPLLTIVIGENARGKTNLLESIYVGIHGYGFRESREEELLMFDTLNASITTEFGSEDNSYSFAVLLKKKDGITQKLFTLNKSKKKFFQYYRETPKAVLFSPEQIDIIVGAPDVRRIYFNKLISSYDFEYKKRLVNYENALRKRNKILESHSFDRDLYDELSFWNDYLEKEARYLTQKRQAHVDFLNENQKIDNKEFSIEYLKNEFSKERLKEKFEDEKKYRRTLIGPQKDEFQIFQSAQGKRKNIHHFGSRSEQRMGVFWLKLNEVNYLEMTQKIKPIVLLDDVFSELDVKNKKLIFQLIKNYQTVITTTEDELIDLIDMQNSIIRL